MNFLLFAFLHFLVVISPGPSFIGMTSFALNYGFKKTLPYVIGLGVGNIILSLIAIFGLSELIFSFPLFSIIFYMSGGLVLILFGIKTFKPKTGTALNIREGFAFWTGFGVEILNPKALLFTTSLFAILLNPDSSYLLKGFALGWVIILGFIYDITIIICFIKFKQRIIKYSKYINFGFGMLLIFFGIRFIDKAMNLLLS